MARRKGNAYQGRDRFGEKAQGEGYLARSVYKLEEIDRRFRVLKQGQRVVDLGCFPGSWSQFALRKIGRRGTLVGVDLERPKLSGGHWITESVLEVEPETLLDALGGPADVVLSDMAPRTVGVTYTDHVRQMELARRAFDLSLALLAPGGTFLVKVFDGEEVQDFQTDVRAQFERTRRVRPKAVRTESREFFMLAVGKKDLAEG